MLLVGNASGDWQHTVATNSLWLGSLAKAGFFLRLLFPGASRASPAHGRAENGSLGGQILLAP
jgi:NADPH2:quinone reductase